MGVAVDDAGYQWGAEDFGVLVVGVDALCDVVLHQGEVARHGGLVEVFPITARHS